MRSAAERSGTEFLHLGALTKRFGELTVLDDVDLDIAEGETLVLLGPSGSGKTTLLRCIAGFEDLDEGAIVVDGEDVTALPPARRNFGMVFQHYALFPHLTVGENVAFGLETRRVGADERRARTEQALELVELEGFGERRVDQISGGQQQRVALARALAPHPRVLLLDEPLSNLDPALRERTREQLGAAIDRVGITTVWVTHEQDEAFDVGDRIAVLHRGVLEQIGTPEELYLTPRSPFVARFVGRASVIEGVWADRRSVTVELADGSTCVWPAAAAAAVSVGDEVEVFFRPEGLELAAAGADGAARGRVVARRYSGPLTLYSVALAGDLSLEVEGRADEATVGDRVGVRPRRGGPDGTAFVRDRGSGSHHET